MADDLDTLGEFECEESSKRKIPMGWLILCWGLIIWGVYYLYSYSPAFSGWSQEKAYQESISK